MIDRGHERLIDWRERVRRADGQGSDVAAAESEAKQDRRENARGETTSIGSKQKRDETRSS